MSLDWIYWAISWILLTWHGIWDAILPGRAFLATNWDWILAIFFLVVTVRIILFPIFVKQIKSQRAMQALQPKVKELQEKHKGDRETLQKEMMELYRREKANPLMGCLPMFLQIPVFLGLFHTLRHIKPTMPEGMRTLYGWTADQFNSAVGAKLLGAPIYQSFNTGGTTTKIVAGVLVVIMMVTTYLTSRQMILKTGWAEDPQQKMIQRLMLYGIPFSLLISGGIFPIGVIVYWVTNNLFTLGQQQWVLHKYPPPAIPTKTILGKATPGRAAATKPGAARSAGKPGAARPAGKPGAAKSAAKNGSGAPVIDGKALAPKPGAKPVNPKKGGTAKRRSG